MVAKRRDLDAATGDYIVENGGPRDDPTHTSQVLFHLRLRKGSSPAFPDRGSRFHEIKSLDGAAPGKAVEFTKEALLHLTQTGAIRKLRPTASVVGNALIVEVLFVDDQGQERQTTYEHQVG